MIALAGLIYLPMRLLGGPQHAIIALHNLLDSVSAERFGRTAWLWDILHQQKCPSPSWNKLRDGLSRAALDRRHGRRLLLARSFHGMPNAVNAS